MKAMLIFAVLLTLVVAGCAQNDNGMQSEQPPENGPIANNVDIVNYAYEPSEITIKIGESVTWTNRDNVGHTVTSETGDELDSQMLLQGETYTHTFNSAGVYNYYCVPHPFMKGSVIVE